MAVCMTGLTASTCFACKRSMFGGLVYSAFEGQEMKCPYCNQWSQFQVLPRTNWIPVPWWRHPPDRGETTEDNQAWQDAVTEIESLG